MKCFTGTNNHTKEYLIVIILYALLTVLLTYPMAFHVNDTIGGGDEAFTCWSLAWTTRALTEDPLNLFEANIFYPANKYSLALSENLIGWTPFSIPLYNLTHDPVLTHNLLRLLTFVLCGFGAYLLSYRYTENRYAAFIAGICFAFFSYRLTIQLHLLAMQWVPFILLYLDRFFYSLKTRDILVSTFFFLLAVLSSWYVGIFTGIIVFIYFIGYLILHKKIREEVFSREALGKLLLSLVIIVLVLAPLAIPYFNASKLYDAERGLDDPMKTSWSLDPIPLFQLIGYIAVLFAFIGLFLPLRTEKRYDSFCSYVRKQRTPIIFFMIGVVSYILMLGPILKIGGNETGVLTPYYYLYNLVPLLGIIRDLSRYSFIMSFAVSILAGFGVAAMLTRVKRPEVKTFASIVFVFLAIAGSWHIPVALPPSLGTGENVPQEYRWLAQQPDDPVIIEIPTRWVEDNSEYTYYSVYHWKRMVNGYSGRDVEEASKIMRDTAGFFPSNTTISLLQNVGVRYVFVHVDRMRIMYNIPEDAALNFTSVVIKEINANIQRDFASTVQFVNSFDSTYVYEIKQTPEVQSDEVVLIFQSGWFGSNLIQPFYLKDTGKITALARSDGYYTLHFIAQPIFGTNNLSISINNATLGTNTFTSGRFYEGASTVHLQKGFNDIRFTSDGCIKLSDIPEMNTLSDRCISFVFANLSVIGEEPEIFN